MKNEITAIVPTFYEWPDSWKYVEQDHLYGKRILEHFEAFALHMISKKLSKKTITTHLNNLWLAGGELIRKISNEEDYEMNPVDLILENFGDCGGPFCRHLNSPAEENSYDSTGRKFYRFMKESSRTSRE